MISPWGEGRFHKFLVMGQPNGSLQQKKIKNICVLGFGP
jgi:hypothetical protein